MFKRVRSLWAGSALTSAVEGVVREANNGNALEVQRWYFKFRTESKKQALEAGKTEFLIQSQAIAAVPPDQATAFREIVDRLSCAGGPLDEVNKGIEGIDPN